jgi:hypothetical protein
MTLDFDSLQYQAERRMPMPEPVFDPPGHEEWDEDDWERFLQRADVRTAKFQELFETLAHHPHRDQLIAREMGWESDLEKCGGAAADCPSCDKRFDCEAYEMFRLIAEPQNVEDDPDADELINCFEQLREIPAYTCAQDFATHVEDLFVPRLRASGCDEDARKAVFAAQMVPAQVAGGHGIGYERDSLCGNIANCKRALRSLETCREQLQALHAGQPLPPDEFRALSAEADQVSLEINRWIESLRARIWWR